MLHEETGRRWFVASHILKHQTGHASRLAVFVHFAGVMNAVQPFTAVGRCFHHLGIVDEQRVEIATVERATTLR